jgi:hypothetical protein
VHDPQAQGGDALGLHGGQLLLDQELLAHRGGGGHGGEDGLGHALRLRRQRQACLQRHQAPGLVQTLHAADVGDRGPDLAGDVVEEGLAVDGGLPSVAEDGVAHVPGPSAAAAL